MAYYIYKTDGTQIAIGDSIVYQGFNDTAPPHAYGAGIQIVGRNVADYVAPIAQSFLQITENFSSSVPIPDTKALQGQLWFEKINGTSGNLYIRKTGALSGGLANWTKILTSGDAISVTSLTASGTISASNFSGSSSGANTGDQTITLTGDVTGSGTGSFATTLATTGVTAGSYTTANITVDAKGRVTTVSSNLTPAFTSVTTNAIAATGNTITLGSLLQLVNKTTAELNALVGITPGTIAFCTDSTPAVPVYYSGTNWCKIFDNSTI